MEAGSSKSLYLNPARSSALFPRKKRHGLQLGNDFGLSSKFSEALHGYDKENVHHFSGDIDSLVFDDQITIRKFKLLMLISRHYLLQR